MKYRSYLMFLFLLTGLLACQAPSMIEQHGRHYREHQDFYSLSMVVEMLEEGADTSRVQALLGEPIDMGFDYRYLVDSVGETGCAVGAVFHYEAAGIIDDQWVGEICE